ncbi:MAG: hypothetical protein U0525_03445 [Patescibacteria group bacterium]
MDTPKDMHTQVVKKKIEDNNSKIGEMESEQYISHETVPKSIALVDILQQVSRFLIVLFVGLLLLRILLSLVGAARIGIVDIIYRLSDPIREPFSTIAFPQTNYPVYIDITSVVAIIVWSVIIWLFIQLLNIFRSNYDRKVIYEKNSIKE